MDQETTLIAIIVGSLLGIIIFALIFKWIFGIEQLKKIQEGQTNLLIEIAQQQGVSKEKIDKIVNTLNN